MDKEIISYQKRIRLTVGREPKIIKEPNKFIKIKELKGFLFGKPSYKDAKEFIERYEWLGYLGRGRIFYAIWKENKLYGVEVFCPLPYLAVKRFPKDIQKKVLYLSRGACCYEAGKNAGSMLLGHSLRELKKLGYWLVIAYSDSGAGEGGYLYKSANFKYAGETSSKGTIYVKINNKWYSPKSLLNSFGVSNYKKLNVQIEEVRKDNTNKKRWIYILYSEIEKYIEDWLKL